MKSLLPIAALALLASCQPSSNNSGTPETLTQVSGKKEAANEKQGTEKLAFSSSKKISSVKVKHSGVFQSYLKEFPQASLPLTLNERTNKSVKQQKYLAYKFERFVPGMAGERFSREVGKEYYALARVSETPQYTAVIYGVKNVMMGDNAPVGYMLTTYGSNGKMIDQIVAGGQVEPENPLRAGIIQADLSIEIKDYKQHWAKNPAEEGYYDNKVVRTTLKATHRYHIAANGRFEEDSRLLGMR